MKQSTKWLIFFLICLIMVAVSLLYVMPYGLMATIYGGSAVGFAVVSAFVYVEYEARLDEEKDK